MVGGNLVYFTACFSSEEGMGPLHPPKTKKERSTAAVPLVHTAPLMNRLSGAERMTSLLMFQSLVFHMVSAKLVGTWRKRGNGREDRLCKSASHHIQPTRQTYLENLKITIFRNSFSNIGRVISIGIKFQSNLYRVPMWELMVNKY